MSGESRLPPTKPYNERLWNAAAEGRLEIQYCGACDQYVYPSRIACPYCFSELEWQAVSGAGTVYSYTALHHPDPSDAVDEDELPVVGAVIELEEEVLFAATLVDCQPDDVTIGAPVRVVFEDGPGGRTLPKFTPTS